ncbi:DUF6443 domain-containing protein [Chryseobacterium soli]|uniref:DUF6443 domain-containing protein n=1 Tax=Chryseobacterium soli TaxID=445961 RepID=UPI00295300C3|nr:DUF6443 domain-containing protein [Chryseobacterium soli]MDV7699527.1 DUF6443 domain-containing protein [Chryseobacterium soli]
MKKIILILYLFFAVWGQAQNLTQAENYTYSRTYLEAVTSEQPAAAQMQMVQYLDGLGRPVQNIAVKASPSAKDIVVPVTYDSSGRPAKSFLPLPSDSQNGAYFPATNGNTVNTYYGVSNAYFETAYEKSPLSRPEKQAMAGGDWQMGGAHTQKVEYALNGAGKVNRFQAQSVWNPSAGINDVSLVIASDDAYTSGGYYNAGTLSETVTKDEDGNEIHSFSNSRGQNILVRQINTKADGTPENLDTYYVYNESGSVVFIIPPKAAVSPISQSILDNLCYQYKYDGYNRLVEKKIPGKGWEYMVYDKSDRLVLTQDANLRAQGKWLFTKYDQFSRPIYTGILDSPPGRLQQVNAIQDLAFNNEVRSSASWNNSGMDVYYTNNTAYPTTNFKLLSVNYYDEYPSGVPDRPTQIQGNVTLSPVPASLTSNGLSSLRSTKTLPTVSFTRNIENENWTSSVLWYDTLGRVIGTYEGNHLGGFTRTETLLDFSGITKEAYTFHSKNSSSVQVTVKDRFVYTPQNILTKHYQQINTQPEELLSEYTYNDIGQLTNKKTGAGLQSIDYSYNIRGWLTGINAADINNLGNKLFAYRIKYNTVEGAAVPNNSYTNLQVKPRYNGSIAEVDWKTASGANEPLRRYGYVYDGAERLLAGFFQVSTNPYSKEYSEVMDYDLGGNITSLFRTGSASSGQAEVMDDLSYTYLGNGNQLDYVTESGKGNALSGYPLAHGKGASIKYDANGNITQHLDKSHQKINYNFLNLPYQILFPSKSQNINYIYSSDGTKLQMIKEGTVTDYLGAFQYTSSTILGEQPFFVLANEEGYYDFTNSRYVYQYKDHLGNVRLSYAKNTSIGQPVILEENNYYPFGLKHAGYNTGDTTNNKFKYLYNGKELQSTGNLDYGWRQYMPDLGRWNGMDQLADKFHSTSTYAYVMNNPISLIDPDGRDVTPISGGYELSGGDIAWGLSYFDGGGSVKDFDTAVANWNLGGGSFGSDNETFWKTSFPTTAIPEIRVKGKKGTGFGEGTYNGAAMYSGLLGALQDLNTQQAMSAWQTAINETEIGKSIGSLEKFLFLEIPMSFAGGELFSAGWRASGIGQYLCRPIGRLTNGLIKICFTEGTLVAAEKGSKKIEDIKEGDLVWSYNEETGKKELKKVVKLSRNTSSSLVKISVNGTEITCTPEHPFYVNGNWVEAKNLIKGTLLTTLDGTTSPVESINFLDEKVKVYNFEVEGNHNYYVSKKNILVHNDCGFFDSLLEKIVSINRATEGGGVLLNGTPSSAVNSAMYYETAAEQGASIFRSISGGHMFMDGNKRTAVEVFKYFAEKNGLNTVSHAEMMNISNQVATGQLSDIYQISRMLIK